MVDYVIGIGAAALVIGIVVKSIINSKNGKESGGCSGNCSSCSACNINYTFDKKK